MAIVSLLALIGCSAPPTKQGDQGEEVAKEAAPRKVLLVGQEGCATITSTLELATPGSVVSIPEGIYSASKGEIFPIVIPEGVRVSGRLHQTIIDVDTKKKTDAFVLKSGAKVQGLTFRSTTKRLGWCFTGNGVTDIAIELCVIPSKQGVMIKKSKKVRINLLLFTGTQTMKVPEIELQAAVYLKECEAAKVTRCTMLRQETCMLFTLCKQVEVAKNILVLAQSGIRTDKCNEMSFLDNNVWKCQYTFYDRASGNFMPKGNLKQNPHFVHLSGADYRLLAFSPCIQDNGMAWGVAAPIMPRTVLAIKDFPNMVSSSAEPGEGTQLLAFVAAASNEKAVVMMPKHSVVFTLHFDQEIAVHKRSMVLGVKPEGQGPIMLRFSHIVQQETEVQVKFPTGLVIPKGTKVTFELYLNTTGMQDGVGVRTSLYGMQWTDGETDIETLSLGEKTVILESGASRRSKEF